MPEQTAVVNSSAEALTGQVAYVFERQAWERRIGLRANPPSVTIDSPGYMGTGAMAAVVAEVQSHVGDSPIHPHEIVDNGWHLIYCEGCQKAIVVLYREPVA